MKDVHYELTLSCPIGMRVLRNEQSADEEREFREANQNVLPAIQPTLMHQCQTEEHSKCELAIFKESKAGDYILRCSCNCGHPRFASFSSIHDVAMAGYSKKRKSFRKTKK